MNSGAETLQFAAARVLPEWAEAQFAALQTELAASEKQRQEQAGEIKQRDLKIQKLTLELAYYRRVKFGAKSESLSVAQQDLFLESCNEDQAAISAELAQLQGAIEKSRPKPTGRKAIPPELPRIEHRHEPASCTCGQCGAGLIKIGEDVSEQLDVEPARFFVHRHIRPQYACRTCETITAAPVAPALIDGGLAAPGLHAWVLIQKYLDHLPLYRIEKISERHGVGIARSTLAQWVGQLGVALQPLVDRLSELLKQGKVLHADETPVQQLDPGKGKTKRAYMWAYRSNDLERRPPIVVFDYQTSRSGQHARDFLAEWRGDLMVDDYGGYKALFQQGVTELACLAHCRRKFFDLHALPGGHPVAEEALRRIGELYALEAEVAGVEAADRLVLRQREALPRLQSLHEWLKVERLRTANGSGLARAVDYTLKRWPAILRYVSRGDNPIDNNPVENAIRPITLGRRNWLFTGSERAGCRAAAIQSLLATAKLNGLEPYAWLKDVLEKLPVWPYSRIDELLPLKPTEVHWPWNLPHCSMP
ncbi:IS66 family transposase [Ferribacterium limneticum]|uniref:IS66 family transposase n=1 Tax=Ferribacterium limneticum TaxID=76259 RepID=UPI00384D8086|nr:IS66 family transposase [Ferribacterium limneticum]UCV30557.1 IS66 family transposase [Ferribacterium limneticum]